MDESLKYHESQQAKVDELQKSIEVLKSENETLLAELGQWRRCLDTPPQQAPTTLPYGPPNALETVDEVSTTTHEPLNFAANYTSVEPCSSMTYRDHLEPDCGTPLELPAAPMNSAIPIQSFSGAVAGIQQIDSYTLQQTALPFAEIPVGDFSLLHSQPSTQSGSFREQPVDAAMWTQQDNQAARQGLMSYQFYHQNLPPDSRRYQF